MTEQEIKVNLDMLANHQAQVEYLRLEKQRLIDEAIPAEIKQRLDEIEAEFAGKAETAQATINSLTEAIKAAVAEYGESVKGTHKTAQWVKGYETWDSKELRKYAGNHPEILLYLKHGKPSVKIVDTK